LIFFTFNGDFLPAVRRFTLLFLPDCFSRSLFSSARVFIAFCESSYCFQRVLAIAILSVRLSVTRVNHSKAVQAIITEFSPSAAWKTLDSGTVKLFYKFEGCHPERRRLVIWGGQNLRFLANKSLYLNNGVRQNLGYY